MTGDQQPRKRKEKRKKKDSSAERTKAEAEFIARKFSVADDSDEGSSPARSAASSQAPQQTGEGDSIIHVHHEHGTGGHWCAKIIFFLLLGALVGLVGLIIAENRGLTDLDSPIESRFSQVFDGWIDEGPFNDDHHDEHTLELKHPEDEHEDDNDEHDDADIENIEEEHQSEDESEHEIETESDDAEPDDDDDEHIEQDVDNDASKEKDDDDASKEKDGDDDDDDEDYLDNDEKDNDDEINESFGYDDDDDDEYLDNNAEENDDDDISDSGENNTPLEEIDSIEENVVENHASEEEHLAAAEAKEQNEEEEEESSSLGLRLGIGLAIVVAAYCLLARRLRSVSNDPDVVVTAPIVNRRMTLVANDLTEDDEDEEETEEQEQAEEEVEEEANETKETFQPLYNPKAAELIKSYLKDDNEEEKIIPQKIVPSTSKPQPKIETSPPKVEEEEAAGHFEDEDIEEIQREEVEELEDVEDEELIEEEEEEVDLDEEEIAEEEDEEDISEEIDDTELMRRLEEKYGKLPEKDDEPPEEEQPVRPSRKRGKPSGEKAVDDSNPDDSNPDDNWDTSSDNWKEQIDLAQAEMDEGHMMEAYKRFTSLNAENPYCPLAILGRARTMDSLAETHRSNGLLVQAIALYKQVLNNKTISDAMFLNVSERVINRQRFLGKYSLAVPIHKAVIRRFPSAVKHRNDLVVTYMMANKVNDSRVILNQTLQLWPNDGVALVHYGFILKTVDNNLPEAIKFLKKGIATGEKGTLEGRFFFHLGDAFARLGQQEEAKKVYKFGASLGVFLSPNQRSLYNVDRLTGRPWWRPEETPYMNLINELESNWKEIAEEALRLRVEYRPEQENLKDIGDWSQFELFIRGSEVESNCAKCPKTCSIVRKEQAASSCRRGQIKFSAMTPGTHVFAHTGPTNCRLRAHLGLIGTKDTFIRVSNETRSWQEGKVFIFDDSFDHEVWHNGTQLRIVLIVDLWHPELSASERASLTSI